MRMGIYKNGRAYGKLVCNCRHSQKTGESKESSYHFYQRSASNRSPTGADRDSEQAIDELPAPSSPATPLLVRVNDNPRRDAHPILYAEGKGINVILLNSTKAVKDWAETHI